MKAGFIVAGIVGVGILASVGSDLNLFPKNQAQGPPLHYTLPDTSFVADLDLAVAILKRTCPDLALYRSDIDSVHVEYREEEGNYESRAYGWDKQILITIKVSGAPVSIPSEYNAAGHTIPYMIGAGTRPGIAMIKQQACDLCGINYNRRNALIDVEEVKQIAALSKK